MDRINEKIRSEVENITIVDTHEHEHIMNESEHNEYAVTESG